MALYRAEEDGFYRGSRIRKGAVFNLRDGDKVGTWMVEASAPVAEAKADEADPQTLSEATKRNKPTKAEKVLAGE